MKLNEFMEQLKIGLLDIDGHNFPNFALMKIASYHKNKGDSVTWYDTFQGKFDIVYKSKVFTFTPDYGYFINSDKVISGGTGYDVSAKLSEEIDRCFPDYSIYPTSDWYDGKTAYGFLTRGCIRNCSWCVVPKKEGAIRPYADIEGVLQDKKRAVLMDNNVLACDYGIKQIEKIVNLGCRVDFNQGLDCRLVTDDIAHLLSRVKWIECIRFSCDTIENLEPLLKTIERINKHGIKNWRIFVYLLVRDVREANKIADVLKKIGVSPYAQPYRDFENKVIPTVEQKEFANYVNKKSVFKSTTVKSIL